MSIFGPPETSIDEKCSCGAEFHYRGMFATSAVHDWRTMHHHRTASRPTGKETK